MRLIYRFFLFFFPWFYPHLTTENVLAEAKWGKRDWKTITFPRSAILLAVNLMGSIILLAGSSHCEPGVDIILREGVTRFQIFRPCENSQYDFDKIPPFKWINGVCKIDGIPWTLARTLTEQCGTKVYPHFFFKSNYSLVAASERNTFTFSF